MKILFRHTRVFTFLLTLLLLGGTASEAYAAKVRYHILTKPFSIRNHNNGGFYKENIRVEALLVVSDAATVGLPEQYMSPLATNFQYYSNWETPTYTYLFDYTNNNKLLQVKYYLYSQNGGESYKIANPSEEEASNYADIYVTYDLNTEYANTHELFLGESQDYNITVGRNKFLCYNRSRNNRIANANTGALTGEDLVSTEFVVPPAGSGTNRLGFSWSTDQYAGAHGVHMGFYLTPTPKDYAVADPYNITIMTAYKGNETYHRDPVDGEWFYKPYRGATLFSMMKNNADGTGTDTKMWFSSDNDRHYRGTSEENWESMIDYWPGFYRHNIQPLFNSVALLNHPKGGYVFVASKLNQGVGNNAYKEWAPNSKGNYATLTDDNNNPFMSFKTLESSPVINIYKIRTYTFKIKTHGSDPYTFTTTKRWSDAKASDKIVDHIPDALKRKYCSYKAYSDEGLTNEISTFEDAKASAVEEDGKKVIWLDYNVTESMPFETLSSGSYQDAHWYTMRMNGKAEPKNIAYNSSNNLITGGTSKGSNTDLHQGENSADAMVAFIGDPYRLKIISRAACEANNGIRYVGCATSSENGTGLSTIMTNTSDIITWEIVYEGTDMDNFVLRQYRSLETTPMYVGWGSTSDKPVTYSNTESRIRVVELDKKKYAFHIMRADKSIAVMASTMEDVGKALKSDYTDIPEIIRSPYLSTATVNFYDTEENAQSNDPTKKITNLPYDGAAGEVYAHIWVRYTFVTPPSGGTYNVILNNDYIFTSSGDAIQSQTGIDADQALQNPYQWLLNYSDPYAMTIKNQGKNEFVNIASWTDAATLNWVEEASATKFIVKSSGQPRTYEVMAATGNEIDASTTYYNIGRPDANTVKLYSNRSYLHGNATLRFQLIGTSAHDVTYHLVDKSNTVLLKSVIRQADSDPIAFPPEYHSPLVDQYHYYSTLGNAQNKNSEINISTTNVGSSTDFYVTYDVNDLINLKSGQLYLLKYEAGKEFHQEDGSDGVNPTAQKAVYPYVNGDGNFFVYGKEQYDLQQEGAASTRTRWAWYVQSNIGGTKGDPYHVTIRSRQSESYPITNSSEYNAYFMTYKPDDYTEVVTTLAWPGMSSETATEYMVLGSEGQYQLVTSYPINGSRYVVDSFEQYWKTYDTVRRKLLKQPKKDYPDRVEDPITVPETPCVVEGFDNNRTYLETSPESGGMGFHHYAKWAYAKRWNGHNNGYSNVAGTPDTKKGWETIEHWFQTVDMGQGYFDFVKTSIDPVLILLDQHGWEIMRKPLPNSPDDPEKEAKYEAIRPYNSPMVKEYAFWATAKKRTGLHQYYLLSDRVGGENFTSTDLTKLPPYGSANVLDKKGNQNDQYVTYIVKDEYAQTYQPGGTPTAKPFLIEQGIKHKYATTDGSTISATAIPGDDMKAHILNDNIPDTEKWYVKPNATIDNENGYNDVSHNWDATTPNAYEDNSYSGLKTAVYIKETDEYKNADAAGKKALTDKFGQFSFSNGFDPYNIQIESVSASKYMKTNASGATLEEGSMIGTYSASPAISLGDNTTIISPKPRWYDSRNLDVTNATFMAVQDAEGNMQLMPRFDHALRMSEFGTLIAPTDAEVAKTYTKLYRPEVYEYLIIDNDGHESLRYKTGGDLTPQIPDHFQSPLATNFTYYATATATTEAGVTTYSDIKNEIKESLDGATLTVNAAGNKELYVRYEYNSESDSYNMLKGNWLTMKVNGKDAIYSEGIKQGTSKPEPINSEAKAWQWKFLETPQSKPDPYAIYIYNRSQTAGTEAISDRFALLSHSAGDYALAKAGKGDYTYQFLNGDGMDASKAATITTETGFTPTSGSFDETKSQVKLTDEVQHTFTYKVYTNGGVNAIDASQTQDDVHNNDWKPVLPEAARTPLLDIEQYRYYEKNLTGTVAEKDTLGKSLSTLYGLYDDIVYTHYTPYNEEKTGYLVPNVKTTTGSPSHVARSSESNDAPLGLNGSRPYNIIWYNDNMMKANGAVIECATNPALSSTVAYEWVFEGNDPYAIKIRNKSQEHGDYILENTEDNTRTKLSDGDDKFTPFMLLNREGYEYGVFAKTGNATTMLSGCGDQLTTSDPTKFIIFALSTNKVIYHLMIKNIGTPISIPYKGEETGNVLREDYPIKSSGTTMRDLQSIEGTGGPSQHTPGDKYQLGETLGAIGKRIPSTLGIFGNPPNDDVIYCHDAGHVSLGDKLEVPSKFYRPNVNYDFYIGGVYASDGTAGTGTVATEVTNMNNKYKGVKVDGLGEDSELLDKIIFVNIVYSFMGGLDTNSGSDFVTDVSQNKWYTFETNDATPMLAEYTGSLQTKSGYATHYTNDYLWTPVGDPYGFKMYNRYAYKNSINQVMTTTAGATPSGGDVVSLGADNANAVYELLATNTTSPGYFIVHPVVNLTGLQYYMNNNTSTGTMTLSTTPTEWTFGLSEDVMRPYYLAAGYVGGLNAKGKEVYEAAVAETDPSKMLKKLMDLQDVVYNHDNDGNDPEHPNYIVHYTPGYYRLHNQPGSSGISTPRYASGYTHMIEKDVNKDGNEADAIPMHFYEVEDYGTSAPVFTDLGTAGKDYSNSPATRGDLPLQTVTNDPASIFYFYEGTAANPTTKIQTQGLYVNGNKMTATEGSATSFKIIDIGAGVVALQSGDNFLKYAQNVKKYDLKFDNTASTIESTRWCMKPVQKSATAGEGEMELRVKTNNGGDNFYYTTFCAPFDVLMTNERDVAYVIPPGEWPTTTTPGNLYPKEIGEYTSADNNQFIPAGTPVIIRTSNPIGYVTMALPNSNPSPAPVSCLFTGKYLEQMLTQGEGDVYVFGRDLGTYTKDNTTGQIISVSPEPSTGIGFYINANPNKEANENKASWTRHNYYVLHNKIYYRAGSSGVSLTRGPEFVPVLFEAAATDVQGVKDYSEGMLRPGNVYNLQGRCVATEEMVKDGTWKNNLTPGVYIMSGKKIIVK